MSTTSEGRPGKYQRSAAGLVGAMVLTLALVLVLLWVLGIFRRDLAVEPDRVDHLQIVEEAQDSGLELAYPAALPEDWIATALEVEPGDSPVFELRLLTDDERFVGVHEEDAAASDLLRRYVDEETSPIDDYETTGSVADTWDGFTDEEGDTAYTAEVADRVVLVYGSASAAELQDVIDRLTTAPVEKKD